MPRSCRPASRVAAHVGEKVWVWKTATSVAFRVVPFTTACDGDDGVPATTFTMPPMADGPIEDDRAWFAVGFSGDALSAVRADGGFPFRSHVLFVGRDGTVRDSTCDLAECTDAGSRAAYATVRELVSSYAGLG